VIEAINPENEDNGLLNQLEVLLDMLSLRRGSDKALWTEIGECLKALSTPEHEEPFLSLWVCFSEKHEKFTEQDCEDAWPLLDEERGADLATLKFWASKDSPRKYTSFKRNEVRKFLLLCLNTTHYDVAQTLHILYQSRYVCSSIKNNTWFEFKKHRWYEVEAGVTLKKKLSNELAKEYERFKYFCIQMAQRAPGSSDIPDDLEYDVTPEDIALQDDLELGSEDYLAMSELCDDIITKLKMKGYKESVMATAKEEFFFDGDFEDKLNERHELLQFENGVMDFDRRVFREGRPDDFITYSTKTKYIPHYKELPEYDQIMTFVKQIYLTDEMVHYALKERAHSLHGHNFEERIFAWIGVGGNGKSKFRELCTLALGDYVLGFEVTLFTGKRSASNAPKPEVARGKGKRMAFVDEPEENQRLNMGLMKKLSGGDPVECRKLYGDVFEYIPQYSITLLANDMPKVPAHDEGTRRRLCAMEHRARFVDNPTRANEFKRDRTLSTKLKKWKHVFSSMMVDYYFAYVEEGLTPPEDVTKFTEQFMRECDAYDEFISDSLVEIDEELVDPEKDYVALQTLYATFKSWTEDNGVYTRKPMSYREFKKYLSKRVKNTQCIKDNRLFGYRERADEMAAVAQAVY
jgi:P4 family phage/plasmid primase-like protien